MSSEFFTAFLLIVIFVTSLLRFSLGFGSALVAMPLLALVMDVRVAVPLVAFIATVIITILLIKDWQDIQWKNIGWFLLSSIAGLPLGIMFIKGSHESIVKICLGVMLIFYSSYCLVRPKLLRLKTERFSFIFGFLAGVIGGAYNTNGPPIVVYGMLRQWPAEKFRATLQGFFFPASVLILASHAVSGLWTKEVFRLVLVSLPAVLPAMLLARWLDRFIENKHAFDRYVHVFLVIVGGLLIAGARRG